MSDNTQRRASRSSPTDDPHLQPLVSAADVPRRELPTVQIPPRRLPIIEEHGRERARNGARGTEQNHAVGIIGETVTAKFLGTTDGPDTALYDNGDGGVDLTYNGATIDVKTVGRQETDPALTVGTYQPLNADYYVLVNRIGPNECRLIGYATRHFVANAQQWENRHGETYHLVPQSDLFPFPRRI
jgi:hypothetical protein